MPEIKDFFSAVEGYEQRVELADAAERQLKKVVGMPKDCTEDELLSNINAIVHLLDNPAYRQGFGDSQFLRLLKRAAMKNKENAALILKALDGNFPIKDPKWEEQIRLECRCVIEDLDPEEQFRILAIQKLRKGIAELNAQVKYDPTAAKRREFSQRILEHTQEGRRLLRGRLRRNGKPQAFTTTSSELSADQEGLASDLEFRFRSEKLRTSRSSKK